MEDLEFNDQHDNKIQDGEITVVRHEIAILENNNNLVIMDFFENGTDVE